MLEKTVKKYVRARLKELGCYQFWPVMMGLGAATLDVIGCVQGFFFAVECKAPDGVLSQRQKFTITEMKNAGAVVLVVDSIEKAKAITLAHLMGKAHL